MGRTIRVDESVQIGRPPAEVWSAIADYTIELQPTGGMRVLGPLLGSIVRSGLKNDLRKLKSQLEGDR